MIKIETYGVVEKYGIFEKQPFFNLVVGITTKATIIRDTEVHMEDKGVIVKG